MGHAVAGHARSPSRDHRVGIWRALLCSAVGGSVGLLGATLASGALFGVFGVSLSTSGGGWPWSLRTLSGLGADVAPALIAAVGAASCCAGLARLASDGRRPVAWWPLTAVAFAALMTRHHANGTNPLTTDWVIAVWATLWVICAVDLPRLWPGRWRRLPVALALTVGLTVLVAVSVSYAYLHPLMSQRTLPPFGLSHVPSAGPSTGVIHPGGAIVQTFVATNVNRPDVMLRSIQTPGISALSQRLRLTHVGGFTDGGGTFPGIGAEPPVLGKTLAGSGGSLSLTVTYTLTSCSAPGGAIELPALILGYTVLGQQRSTTLAAPTISAVTCKPPSLPPRSAPPR